MALIEFSCFFLFVTLGFDLSAQADNIGIDKFSISVNNNILKIPYYANQDIYQANDDIVKAVIVVHGNNRDADEYFDNMMSAANSASISAQGVLIIAPQLLTEEDINFHGLDDEHLYWSSGGWKAGSNSRDESANPRPVRIPSYAVLDSLMLHLAQQYSQLSSIVFTGHSAGGQVAQRMAATSPMPDILCRGLDINTRYVVANPSSYVYLDDNRKASGSTTEFRLPSTSCSTYNEWKYGLEELYTYGDRIGADSIRNMYRRRVVTYLLGEEDNNPNSSSLDLSCEARQQGSHRLERGQIYYNYLKFYYGEEIASTHHLITVPGAAHSNFDMYNSPQGIFELFERTSSSCDSRYTATKFDSTGYIEYTAGNLPIILSAPHGGLLDPVDIPDRDCSNCVYVNDSYTQEIARGVSDRLVAITGCQPHLVINLLHRRKLDANRTVGEAADGDPTGEKAWRAYHRYMHEAKASVERDYGQGIVLDLHGHAHDIQRIELGYLLTRQDLESSTSEIDDLGTKSSIKNLSINNRQDLSFSSLLRGQDSFGSLLEDQNLPTVPSDLDPFPFQGESYFTGGYITRRHGSVSTGSIDAIQIEMNQEVRFDEVEREELIEGLVESILTFVVAHYISDFRSTYCRGTTTSTIDESINMLNVYPNPASDIIRLEGIERGARVIFFDLLGREALRLTSEGEVVDIQGLESGYYLVVVSDANSREVGSVVVEK